FRNGDLDLEAADFEQRGKQRSPATERGDEFGLDPLEESLLPDAAAVEPLGDRLDVRFLELHGGDEPHRAALADELTQGLADRFEGTAGKEAHGPPVAVRSIQGGVVEIADEVVVARPVFCLEREALEAHADLPTAENTAAALTRRIRQAGCLPAG